MALHTDVDHTRAYRLPGMALAGLFLIAIPVVTHAAQSGRYVSLDGSFTSPSCNHSVPAIHYLWLSIS